VDSGDGRSEADGHASALTRPGPGGVAEHLRRQPAVPVGPAATRAIAPRLTEVTRRLSANAYARPDRLADLSAWLIAKIAGGSRKGSYGDASRLDEEPQRQKEPKILLGDDYINWIRRRVAKDRPVPSFGFDEHIVLGHCLRAQRLRYQRRALASFLAAPGLAIALLRVGPWQWGLAISAVGMWLAFYKDRVVAQRLLYEMRPAQFMTGHSPEPVQAAKLRRERFQSWALPYTREWRRSTSKEHFIGAGRLIWNPASIGIDVEPAPCRPPDRANHSKVDGKPRIPGDLERLLTTHQRDAPNAFRDFTVEELYDFVARRLADPAPSHAPGHPFADIEVLGVAAVSADRWGQLDKHASKRSRPSSSASREPQKITSRCGHL